MAPGITLSQGLRQTQVLAPQMRQALDMLQKPIAELRAEIRQQLETNPVIEDVATPEIPLEDVAPEEHASDEITSKELDFTPDGEAAERTLGADDGFRDYVLGNMENAPTDEAALSRRQYLFDSQVKTETLQQHLLAQVPLSDIAPTDRPLAEILIGNIDDGGLFTGSLPDIEMVTGADAKRVNAVLRRILKFDPAGCGARDLRECLLAQLDKLDDDPWQNEVRLLVARHLEDIAAGRIDAVCAALGISRAEYDKALASLRTLDPRPGRAFPSETGRPAYIYPDVHAVYADGKWTAHADGRDIPDIRISPRYLKMLESADTPAETKSFIRERIRAAEEFRAALEKRQETVRAVAQAIFDAQPAFFEKGLSGLRPLTMQEIADKTGVHATTISRTVNGKYVTTPKGTVELRKFFTSGVVTESGEALSVDAVLARLKALVDAEDPAKPLSDEKLAAALNAEGIDLARRTVAKYRDRLGIPGTSARRAR